MLYDKDMDYTRLLAKYFERSLRAQGGRVLVSAGYENAAHAVQRLHDGASSDEDGSSEESEGDGDGSGESDAGPGSELIGDAGAGADRGRQGEPGGDRRRGFVAAGPEDAPRIVRALRAAGYRQPVIGGDSFDSAALVSAAEKSAARSTTPRIPPSA